MSINGEDPRHDHLKDCVFDSLEEITERTRAVVAAAFQAAEPHCCNGVAVGLLLSAAGYLTSEFNLREEIAPTPRTKTDAELKAWFHALAISDVSALWSLIGTALLHKSLHDHDGEGHDHG